MLLPRHYLLKQLTEDGVQCNWSVITGGGVFAAFLIYGLYDDPLPMRWKGPLC